MTFDKWLLFMDTICMRMQMNEYNSVVREIILALSVNFFAVFLFSFINVL